MKRILQITGSLVRGGTEAYIMNNYRNIDRNHYQFDFYILYPECIDAYVDEIENMGGRIFKGVPASVGKICFAKKSLLKILKEYGPYDAVHCHLNFGNAWLLYAAKLAGVKVRISHSHAASGRIKGIMGVYSDLQARIIKKNANVFLACSSQAGAYLYGKRFFEKKGHIIKNGIDLDRMYSQVNTSHSHLLEEWSIPRDNVEIWGNISRFDENKNQIFILDVFNEYLKKCPATILVLGGPDGGQLKLVKERVHELGLEKKVRFIGVREDISLCLQTIDCFLFPSLYEGFGIAVLEAQVMGCNCYVSETVPQAVDLHMGNVHFLSLKDSSRSWAEYIHNAQKNKAEIFKEDIEKAFYASGFCIQSSVKELMQVYDGN